jgi:alpha-glucosidase
MKDVIKQQVLATGVSGWMGDFGEGLPLDARIHTGDAASYHNRYPEEWARLQREAVREAGRSDDVVYFSRSGFTRSPGLTRLFWAGDQLTTWDEHDGLKSSIVALLSSGLSGMTLNHSDIGGYTTLGIGPVVMLSRPRELFLRWMEVNAFTAVYRTHQGLHPGAGQQLDSDPGTLDHFARMAKVFKALFPYRKALMVEAEQRGAPLVRHPFLHDPVDVLLRQDYAFMLGSEYFIAPVVDPGRATAEATLPRGRWVHLWSGQVYGSQTRNVQVSVSAPIGRPAVFYREGSPEGARFVQELARLGIR